ncbi:hypothetical protein Q1695_011770 [Nippostrongylus brasiliensis]|nr:hypothetical protein Q1695_011770 [Nippostrongylus brasiliensis]
MRLLPLCTFILLVDRGARSGKLTKKENEWVKEHCGLSMRHGEVNFKSFGGKRLKKNEYPWIAAVKGGGRTICTASLISRRHLLTAAHCIMVVTKKVLSQQQCRWSGYMNTRSLYGPASFFKVIVGSFCQNPDHPSCKKRWVTPKAMWYHERFDECSLANDFALIELPHDVKEDQATPICLPRKDSKFVPNLIAIGDGLSRPFLHGESVDSIPRYGFQTVNVSLLRTEGNIIKTTLPPGIGICSGDSGGPLVQTRDGERDIQFGVTSNDNTCRHNYKTRSRSSRWHPCSDEGTYTVFGDVRKHLDWICSTTGVCPTESEKNAKYPPDYNFCSDGPTESPPIIMKGVEHMHYYVGLQIMDRCLLIFIWIFFCAYDCKKLTYWENVEINKRCGEPKYINRSHDHIFKSFGGRRVKKFEFPWLVAMNHSGAVCSGSLISRRHVLSAAHCILETVAVSGNESSCASVPNRNMRHMREVAQWEFYVGTLKPWNPWSTKVMRVQKVLFLSTYDECTNANDIALFELEQEVPENAIPICLPKINTPIQKQLSLASVGSTAPSSEPESYVRGEFVINITFVREQHTTFITTAQYGVGICGGDSGGGVFQCTNGRRCEIMGVVSEGSSCEENYKYRNETERNRKIDPQSQEDLFTDVRKYVEWICEATGICYPLMSG